MNPKNISSRWELGGEPAQRQSCPGVNITCRTRKCSKCRLPKLIVGGKIKRVGTTNIFTCRMCRKPK